MENYKTAEEKALEWDISSRHVQYLCRTGKIEGAIKRAGSWFIPADVPVPTKNTKSNSTGFKFVGTKEKIFSSAIELFMLKGFNEVSLRDIADRVGIRQSTIYNHFKSKQDILDTIYDFYCYYYQIDRPSLNDMRYIVQNESIDDIMRHISYDFKEEYKQKLLDISKILFQRVAIDERAREISKEMILDGGIKHVEDVFNMGIKLGRFGDFDTHALSVFINSVRIFTLYYWIISPDIETMIGVRNDEMALYSHATRLFPDLKPPVQKD